MINFDDLHDDIIYLFGIWCDLKTMKIFGYTSKKINQIIKNIVKSIYADYYNYIKSIKSHLCNENYEKYYISPKSVKNHYDYINKKQTFVRTMTTHFFGNPGANRRSCTCIDVPKNINNLVIKNIRYKHQHMIRSVNLSIGGWYLEDKISDVDSELLDLLRYLLKIEDPSILPFSCVSGNNYLIAKEHEEIRIYIEFNDKFMECDMVDQISYDIYEVEDIVPYQNNRTMYSSYYDLGVNKLECISQCFQYTGAEAIFNNDKLRIKCSFNHIINYVFFTFNVNVNLKSVSILFVDDKKNKYELVPLLYEIGNYYVINLVKTLDIENIMEYGINFSCIDIYFDFKFDSHIDDGELKIYGLGNISVLHYANGEELFSVHY